MVSPRPSKTVPAVLVLIAGLLLNACNTTREEQGTLLGAVAGGILGNQIGGGRGQILATGAGAAIGALSGSAIGRSMDDIDRMKMAQAQQLSLETSRIGERTQWSNPDSGNSGSIEPLRTYQNSSGEYCRDFQQITSAGDETEQMYVTACRQPDGSWKMVGV